MHKRGSVLLLLIALLGVLNSSDGVADAKNASGTWVGTNDFVRCTNSPPHPMTRCERDTFDVEAEIRQRGHRLTVRQGGVIIAEGVLLDMKRSTLVFDLRSVPEALTCEPDPRIPDACECHPGVSSGSLRVDLSSDTALAILSGVNSDCMVEMNRVEATRRQ